MRTTLNLDNDIIDELKYRARVDGVSIAAKANQVLRHGLNALQQKSRPQKKYREEPVDMGTPGANIDKALYLVSTLDDEEILRKIDLRK